MSYNLASSRRTAARDRSKCFGATTKAPRSLHRRRAYCTKCECAACSAFTLAIPPRTQGNQEARSTRRYAQKDRILVACERLHQLGARNACEYRAQNEDTRLARCGTSSARDTVRLFVHKICWHFALSARSSQTRAQSTIARLWSASRPISANTFSLSTNYSKWPKTSICRSSNSPSFIVPATTIKRRSKTFIGMLFTKVAERRRLLANLAFCSNACRIASSRGIQSRRVLGAAMFSGKIGAAAEDLLLFAKILSDR